MYAIVAARYTDSGVGRLEIPWSSTVRPSVFSPRLPVKNQDPLAKILTSKILKFYWTLISLWPRDI